MGKSGRFAPQQCLNFSVLKFTKLKGLYLGINSQYLDTILLRYIVRIQREKRRDSHQNLRFAYCCSLRIAIPHLQGVLDEFVGGKRRTIVLANECTAILASSRRGLRRNQQPNQQPKSLPKCTAILASPRRGTHYLRRNQQHLPCSNTDSMNSAKHVKILESSPNLSCKTIR